MYYSIGQFKFPVPRDIWVEYNVKLATYFAWSSVLLILPICNRFKLKGVGSFKANAFGGEPERAKMAAKPPIFASQVKFCECR